MKLVRWMMIGVLATTSARAQVATIRKPPLITGYLQQDCVNKGDELRILGADFGEQRGDNRIVLWDAGQSIEIVSVIWRDTEITVHVPTDLRVVAGREYRVRFESFGGQPLGNPGPPLKICAVAAADKPAGNDARVSGLAAAVYNASGGAQWSKIKSLSFRCHVTQGEQPATVTTYAWDLRASTVTVAWGDKTVTINLRKPGGDADAKAAQSRWTTDSRWLLMPLQLPESAAQLTFVGTHVVAGQQYTVIRCAKPAARDIYIDPATMQVRYEEFPQPNKKSVTATWDKYEKFDGLTLSMEHRFGDKRIWFTDVKVE